MQEAARAWKKCTGKHETLSNVSPFFFSSVKSGKWSDIVQIGNWHDGFSSAFCFVLSLVEHVLSANDSAHYIWIFFINELNQACLCRSVETYLLDSTGTGFQVDKFFESVGVFIGVFSGSFFLGFAMGLLTALVSFQKFFWHNYKQCWMKSWDTNGILQK